MVPLWFRTIAATAVLTGIGLAQPAQAIEILGFTFFEGQEADSVELIDPLPYTIEVTGGPQNITDAISAASSLVRRADLPAAGSSGLLTAARNDYAKIVDALYANGHYGGEVSITINGAEAAALPFNVEIDGPATIAITVDPGPAYLFSIAGIENRHPGTAIAETGFARGAVARSTAAPNPLSANVGQR